MSVLAVACAAVTVLGVGYILRTRIERVGPWLQLGVALWSVGLCAHLYQALASPDAVPVAAHLLWIVALPITLGGAYVSARERRNLISPMLVADVTVVSVACLMLLYKACLWRPGHDRLGDVSWFALAVLFTDLLIVCALGLLAANLPIRALATLGVGELLFLLHDALNFFAHGRDFDTHGLRLALLLCGAVLVVSSLALLRVPEPGTVAVDLETRPRVRDGALLALTALPLVPYMLLMRGGSADAGSLVLSAFLVAAFATREWYRASQSKQLMARLAEEALRDPLTSLANRRSLENSLRLFGGRDAELCVMTIDVDRFKEVNRHLGHGAGDQLLIALAGLLRTTADISSFRLGGDEFAVLGAFTPQEAREVAEGLRARAATHLTRVAGVEALAVTLSIGVAYCDPAERATDPLAVLTRSTEALRAAKVDRNRVRFFSDEDAQRAAHREQLQTRLRIAVNRCEIDFVYQPIISIQDGTVVGLEALARWHDAELGTVSPGDFIPVAERAGFIHDLGRQCLAHSVALQARLYADGLRVGMSVNVSPVQLRRDTFYDDVVQLMQRHDLPPESLTLELTEGVFIDPDDPAVQMLRRLNRHGFRIAIDDFGSGYSSLGYITRLPVDVLKLDRSMISRLHRPEPRSIVSALLDVAGAHGVVVVIEGVESESVLADLRALGAQFAQGWLYTDALPAAEVPDLIRARGGALIPGRRARVG